MARQRKPVVIRPSQSRQQSKSQREKSKQRAIIVAGIIAILFILAIPAYGYWTNFVAPPRSVVLQVDDTKYTLGYVAKYMKGLQEIGGRPDLSVEPFRLLQLLEENEIVRSGALARGLTLDPADVDAEVRARILGDSADLEDVPADQLDREFKEGYKQYLSSINLSKKEHRRLVEADLFREKLVEDLARDIPEKVDQAQVFWIAISEENAANVDFVLEGLEAGEEFGLLAEEFSEDRTTAVNGGELGWVPQGAYPPLDETIFSLEPGEVSDPINVGGTQYIVKVGGFEEDRLLEPEMRIRMEDVSLQIWTSQERGNHRINVCFGGGSAGGSCDWQYDWLIEQIREASLR